MSQKEKLYLTRKDYALLESLTEKYPHSAQAELLEEELCRAEVVSDDDIPDHVVTLRSRARVLDQTTGSQWELTVVPPGEPDLSSGRVSVLAPVGAALIGLSEGQVIDWPMPSGERKRLQVAKVLYQPEAAAAMARGLKQKKSPD